MKATLCLEAIGHNTYQLLKDFDNFTRVALKQKGNWLHKQIAKASLIGSEPMPTPCWVAELVLINNNIYRKYLEWNVDYSRSNSEGSRGVYYCYILESGRVYAVKSPTSWNKISYYFCRVNDDGEIIKISEEETETCLKKEISE